LALGEFCVFEKGILVGPELAVGTVRILT